MPRFREQSPGSKTVNKEGAEAYKETPELELVSLLLTSFVQDSYYESASEQLERLRALVQNISDKKFPAQTAIFARNEYGLRSITHALIGELVKGVKGQDWVKRAVSQTVRRPDDMLEMLGYYLSVYKKPIPNALKKGLGIAINKFDEYQLAKYRGARSNLKLVDLVNLVHPKPKKELVETFKKLMKDELKSTETWEAKQTEAGKKASKAETKEEKAEILKTEKEKNWKELLESGKLGYFALLRNLRNIMEQAPDMVDEACKQLVIKPHVKKSLVLPFRFYTAYQEIKKLGSTKTAKVLDALSQALDISCENIPDLPGRTMVAIDNSHSMINNQMSKHSVATRAEIAALLGAMMFKKSEDTLTLVFADELVVCNLMKSNSVLANIDILLKASAGMGYETNGYKAPEYANKNKIKIDNFLIFTDLQMYDAEGVRWERTPPKEGRSFKKEITDYRSAINPEAKVYSFDCAGYGTLQIPQNDSRSYLIPGFSEKMFDVIKVLDQDRNALITRIKQIKI